MEPIFVVITLLLVAIFGTLIYAFFLRPQKEAQTPQSMLLMQQQLQDLSRTMREQMSESNRVVQQGSQVQFRESKELMQQINREST